MVVRKARADDLQQVRRVLVETWHDTYDAIIGPERVTETTDSWHAIEALRRQLAREDDVFLVAEDEGALVATAYGRHTDDGAFEVARLYVLPSCQGRGLGRVLLEELLGHAGDASTIRLEVEPENKRAIAFYERHGFRTVRTSSDCGEMGSGMGSVVMERDSGTQS